MTTLSAGATEMEIGRIPRELAPQLRHALLAPARIEDELANAEAATVPYRAPCPASVQAHRAAAQALRARAERLAGVS